MTLSAYRSLGGELGRDGPIAKALFEQVAREAESGDIPLTGEYNADDARPPFLTSSMQRWYRSYIAAPRGSALQEVRGVFSAIDLGKGQRGFLIESMRDGIEKAKFEQILKEREQYFSDGGVKSKAKALEEARESYEQMKAENGGEDANEWPLRTYVAILALLAIPEIPLNFQSFLAFYSTVPAIAFVVVIAIAAAIGFSSHIVGTIVKQWGDRFGGDVSRRDKMRSARYFALGVLLFTVSMAMIYFPRSYLFKAALERKIVLGEPLTLSDYMGLLVSVGGNFLVWLIGVVVAHMAHSHIPEFGTKQRLLRSLEAKVLAKYEKDLQHRKDKHIGKAQKDITNITQLEARVLRNRPEYAAARAQFEELRKVDNAVLALLEEYRGRLLETLRAKGAKAAFVLDDVNSVTEDKQVRIDGVTYEQIKLRLPYV